MDTEQQSRMAVVEGYHEQSMSSDPIKAVAGRINKAAAIAYLDAVVSELEREPLTPERVADITAGMLESGTDMLLCSGIAISSQLGGPKGPFMQKMYEIARLMLARGVQKAAIMDAQKEG